MALINWNNELSVNVQIIDEQHKKLIELINELQEAMKSGKGKDVLGKILTGLITYTAAHFKTEETYFAQYGYPDAENHKKEHLAFVKKVTDFKDGFDKKQLSLTIEIMNFLRDWLQKHIQGTDKGYSKFFNDKGLK